MNVLHVINTLRGGGAEVNVVRLAQQLDGSRVEPHLAYCGVWPVEEAVRASGLRMFRLDAQPRRVRSWASLRIIARLVSYIRKHRIDVVHTHLFNAHAWGATAARLANAKVIEHVHDHRYTDRSILVKRGLAETRQYDRAHHLARLSDRVVVLTNQNRNYLIEEVGISPAKVSIIPNGLLKRERSGAEGRVAARRRLGIAEDALVVLAVGRLEAEKNFRTLIGAVERSMSTLPHLTALILGEGPERPVLQQQIDRAGLGAVCKLAGHQRDVWAYYDAADIFMQPSIFELQSLAMLEAMQAGLPVVVSQGVGCNDDMITHGETGFILDPNRTDLWADALQKLGSQPALRERIGGQGQLLVDRDCDIAHVARRFEALYEELCGI